MVAFQDLMGRTFARLTVIEKGDRSLHSKATYWLCRCTCGTMTQVAVDRLNNGTTRSCGCLRREVNAASHYIHGGKGAAEHRIWMNIQQRCYNPINPSFKNYGGRGIVMCERWRTSYANFRADMGERPSPSASIDRIDGDGPYSAENCRWASPLEQGRNTRRNRLITHNGITQPLSVWVAETTLPYGVVLARLDKLGWGVERALTTPVRPMQRSLPGT